MISGTGNIVPLALTIGSALVVLLLTTPQQLVASQHLAELTTVPLDSTLTQQTQTLRTILVSRTCLLRHSTRNGCDAYLLHILSKWILIDKLGGDFRSTSVNDNDSIGGQGDFSKQLTEPTLHLQTAGGYIVPNTAGIWSYGTIQHWSRI